MLIDTLELEKDKVQFLKSIWEKFITSLVNEIDPRKIVSFFGKCAVIGIDQKEKVIYLGTPNDFVTLQIKKFFQKKLNEIAHKQFSDGYKVDIVIHEGLSAVSPLHIDLKKHTKTDKKTLINTVDVENHKAPEYFGSPLNSKYRFDNYVVGSNNEFAYAACISVANSPADSANPLFIYGSVGLGKTHLIQAIGNYLIENGNKSVAYLSSTKLIDEIVDAVRTNKLKSFVSRFHNIDVLIIDDIQFLAEKEKTQEVFHNLFNELKSQQKQIIISSDRPPRELSLLEARLRSRFSLGLVVDIKRPDFETRAAIITMKIKERGEHLDSSYVNIIAQHVTDNIRELEGAINIILTKKTFSGSLEERDIYSALKTLGIDATQQFTLANPKGEKKFDNIIALVANYYDIPQSDILGESRKKEISLARQLLMYIAKKHCKWTFEKIGDHFSKNHSSVIYAVNNFEKQLDSDQKIKEDYLTIIQDL